MPYDIPDAVTVVGISQFSEYPLEVYGVDAVEVEFDVSVSVEFDCEVE